MTANLIQDSDYDGAWKEALRDHFDMFLKSFFPGVHREIDWSSPVEWYDKELSQIVGQPQLRNSRVDVLAKVRLKSGESKWILVHLEIQSTYEAGFAERITLYNSGLHWTFKTEVATLVILADLRKTWCPASHKFELADFKRSIEFPTCKLVTELESSWSDNYSLPVILARAQIEALKTSSNPHGRFAAKLKLVRSLYDHGYTVDEVRMWFRLIDWMMHLSKDLEQRFRVELEEIEEELQMPYVTSIERLAKEEGREQGRDQGREEGLREFAISALAKRFDELPSDVVSRLSAIETDQIDDLQLAMFSFHELADLRKWLDQLN